MALEDRVAVAAPSCYITSMERLLATIGPQDAEQIITGQVAFGMEHADYLTMRAPKPTLMCVGTRDYFDIDGAWASFREAKLAFGRFGLGERVDLFESDEAHGFTRPRRQAAARWMRRWLLREDDAAVEADVPIATEAQLRVTPSGQVLRDYPGERSVFALNAERADDLGRTRPRARPAGVFRAEVRRRLVLPEHPPSVIVGGHGNKILGDGFTVDRWAVTTEPGVVVPVRLFRPDRGAEGKPMLVYVGADPSLSGPGGPVESAVKEGRAVATIDPRGMGETAPVATGPEAGAYFGVDERETSMALLLGRPLLGQRVFDVLQALRALEGDGGFHLIGIGLGGPIALNAAALDDRIKGVEARRSVVSWSAVARAPISRGQYSGVVPGVLESYDLPDLAALIAPRPLSILEPRTPDGSSETPVALEAAYAPATAAYRDHAVPDRLILRAAP